MGKGNERRWQDGFLLIFHNDCESLEHPNLFFVVVINTRIRTKNRRKKRERETTNVSRVKKAAQIIYTYTQHQKAIPDPFSEIHA